MLKIFEFFEKGSKQITTNPRYYGIYSKRRWLIRAKSIKQAYYCFFHDKWSSRENEAGIFQADKGYEDKDLVTTG